MGSCSCTRRHFLLSICFLQVITIIERQVFDFLGYMWAPILVNFFHILFIIFGFYGAYHFRVKYIITYLIWNFLWIGWNAFLICFYLNVGQLDRDSDLLNLGTGSVSWFEANGYGCRPTYNMTVDDPFRPQRPESVEGCLLDYTLVELIHSGVQCGLALLGIIGAILISCIFLDEDDRLKHISKQSKHRQSLYSMEFCSSSDTIRHGSSHTIMGMGLGLGDPRGDQDGGELSPKPMTPRRVKRRSVMARGSQGRQSSGGGGSSRRSHHGSSGTLRSKHGGGGHGGAAGDSSSGSYVRSSTRSSRRKYQQNPVTKLIDQQQLQQQQQQLQQPHLGSFHRQDKLSLTVSNLQSLNDDMLNNTNIPGSQLGSLAKNNGHFYHSYRKNIPLDPIYYNTNGQGMIQQQEEPPVTPTMLPPPPPLPAVPAPATTLHGGGHYNPSYQHSTTHLNDVGHGDEVYNNRPPSVRSSYSNFHGSRPLSTAYANAGENVFVGLGGANASPPQPPCTPPLYQQHPIHQQQQQQQHQYLPPPPLEPAPAYVSAMSFSKRTASRESIRSMAFLNNGPPAYNLNYHTPPDSETTM
ncbi:ecdysone-induced protein 75B isoform X2 [Drosophila guanche]|nr:ecdysone-induced protein 75B isoform X2 [Drosophila guanche]